MSAQGMDGVGGESSRLAESAADNFAPDNLDFCQLLRRRQQGIEELYRAYKAEYLLLLDDLKAEYDQYCAETCHTGWKPELAQSRVSRGPLATTLRDAIKQTGGQHGASPSSLLVHGSSNTESERETRQNKHTTDLGVPRVPDLENRTDLDSPIPRFSQVENFILTHQPSPVKKSTTKAAATKQQENKRFMKNLPTICRLEALASCATSREMDEHNALAVLCGEKGRYLILRTAVNLGRGEGSDVDIDLTLEGAGNKVSRKQARLWMNVDGVFQLKNVGRRSLMVDGKQVGQGDTICLRHLSFLEVGGVRVLFMVNQMAIDRMIRSTQQRLNI